jgi:hypothetical protein
VIGQVQAKILKVYLINYIKTLLFNFYQSV